MTKVRTLALAGLALVAAGPALAAGSEVTLYGAPQQQDGFLQPQASGLPVASPLGIPSTTAAISGGAPFWAAHEEIRVMAQDND